MSERACIKPNATGDAWLAECDHGDSVWVIERQNAYLALRSLKAHNRIEHAETEEA